MNLQTLKAERLFRSDAKAYETVVALVTDDARQVVTRRERPVEPGNYYVRTLDANAPDGGAASDTGLRALTNIADATPQLRDIRKQLVKYKRADGVELSFTLYLPPGYKELRRARDDRARAVGDDQLVRQVREERPAAQARGGDGKVSR